MKNITPIPRVSRHLGFTLLELMVVVLIVAILSAIAIPSYQAYIVRSQRASAETQMQRIAGELAAFRSKNLSYVSFDPTYMYGTSVDATKSKITLPVGATGNDIQYTLTIYDVSVPSTPLILSAGAALGRQWAISAAINPTNGLSAKNYNLLLTSLGVKCMTKNTINSPFLTCGTGSVDW